MERRMGLGDLGCVGVGGGGDADADAANESSCLNLLWCPRDERGLE